MVPRYDLLSGHDKSFWNTLLAYTSYCYFRASVSYVMHIGDYRFLSKLDNSVKWCLNIFQWNLNEQAGQLFPVMLTAFGHAKGLFPQTTIIIWLRKISPNKQLFDKWDQFDE